MQEVCVLDLPIATRKAILELLSKLKVPVPLDEVKWIRFISKYSEDYREQIVEVNGLKYGIVCGETDWNEYETDAYEWDYKDTYTSDLPSNSEETLDELIEILEKAARFRCKNTQLIVFHNTIFHKDVEDAIMKKLPEWLKKVSTPKEVEDIYFAGKEDDECTNIVEITLSPQEDKKTSFEDHIELFGEIIPVKVYIYY